MIGDFLITQFHIFADPEDKMNNELSNKFLFSGDKNMQRMVNISPVWIPEYNLAWYNKFIGIKSICFPIC